MSQSRIASLGYVCLVTGVLILALPAAASAQTLNPPTTVTVDVSANRHPISPLIYGVCFGSPDQLKQLNFTIDRVGGDAMTRYNWQNNQWNSGHDWYYESANANPPVAGKYVDDIVAGDHQSGAQDIVTIPMIGWVAKVAPGKTLYSFPVSVFGPQQHTDSNLSDAGNGLHPDGTPITTADPNTANVPSSVDFQKQFVLHEIQKWGFSNKGGVRYYAMDNEPGIWQESHLDVHPNGPTSQEIADDIITYGTMVKSVDPHAQIVAPEEWGWGGFVYSGADKQNGMSPSSPDYVARGGIENMPAILNMIHQHDLQTGKRTIDVFTCHIYPQGSNGVSPSDELLRNRSTRAFWDRNYVDESWIKQPVMMIPRLKDAVAKYYPGTKTGITEYNWGAEQSISGATAQADILGICGSEGLDLATRWTTPDASTPVFKAMQIYRNYDGKDSAFGDLSVSDTAPSPDDLASFAAVRKSDHALTVMVINKVLDGSTPVTLSLAHFKAGDAAQAWQLTSSNVITKLPDVPVAGGAVTTTLPAQSITLFVIPAAKAADGPQPAVQMGY